MIREKTTDTLKLDKKNYLKFRFWHCFHLETVRDRSEKICR